MTRTSVTASRAALVCSLLALFLVILSSAACDRRIGRPSPDAVTSLQPEQVEVVYASGAPPGDTVVRPLWADKAEDQEPIVELLAALASARQVSEPKAEDQIRPGVPDLVVIRHPEGVTTVGRAFRCKDGACAAVPNRWFVGRWLVEGPGTTITVESAALEEWWNRKNEFMPRVKMLNVPQTAVVGEPVTVSGNGLVKGDRVEVVLQSKSGGPLVPLMQTPLDHGSFSWTGQLPPDTGPGDYDLFISIPGALQTGRTLTVVAPPTPAPVPFGQTTPGPEGVNGGEGDAAIQERLRYACSALKGVTSLTRVMQTTEWEGEKTDTGRPYIMRWESPSSIHGIPLEDSGEYEEFIQVDGVNYRRTDPEGVWYRSPLPTPPPDARRPDPPSDSEVFCGFFPVTNDIQFVGYEVLEGKKVAHLKAHADMARKADAMFPGEPADSPLRLSFLQSEETVEAWVDESTHLPVWTKQTTRFPERDGREAYGWAITATYSEFNTPLRIQAPAESVEGTGRRP